MNKFVGDFLDELTSAISTSEFANFFELMLTEHSTFSEPTAEKQIIRVMSNEKRPDNFVTASYSRRLRRQSGILAAASAIFPPYFNDDLYDESSELSLNCTMQRAQLRISLTPKFASLQRIVLVVTCAPSLNNCYIFEFGTQHMLRDFGKYDSDGLEVARRWWKLKWDEPTTGVVKQIAEKLSELVHLQLKLAEDRVNGE